MIFQEHRKLNREPLYLLEFQQGSRLIIKIVLIIYLYLIVEYERLKEVVLR